MAFRIPPPKTPTDGTLLTSARKVADDWYQPPPPKQGPQWRLWVNLPAVELWQAITLSCDIEPTYYLGDADPEFQLRMRIAIGNGLGKGDRPHCALVTLTDVACLARRCGWTLPPEFPKPEPAPARADAEPVSDEALQAEAGVSTDGLVAWQAVMIEAWPEIAKARQGKPTARNAVQWIKKHGPRDVIPAEQPDARSLRWIDRDGGVQTVLCKSVGTRISEWRKAGLIPA